MTPHKGNPAEIQLWIIGRRKSLHLLEFMNFTIVFKLLLDLSIKLTSLQWRTESSRFYFSQTYTNMCILHTHTHTHTLLHYFSKTKPFEDLTLIHKTFVSNFYTRNWTRNCVDLMMNKMQKAPVLEKHYLVFETDSGSNTLIPISPRVTLLKKHRYRQYSWKDQCLMENRRKTTNYNYFLTQQKYKL